MTLIIQKHLISTYSVGKLPHQQSLHTKPQTCHQKLRTLLCESSSIPIAFRTCSTEQIALIVPISMLVCKMQRPQGTGYGLWQNATYFVQLICGDSETVIQFSTRNRTIVDNKPVCSNVFRICCKSQQNVAYWIGLELRYSITNMNSVRYQLDRGDAGFRRSFRQSIKILPSKSNIKCIPHCAVFMNGIWKAVKICRGNFRFQKCDTNIIPMVVDKLFNFNRKCC